MTSAADPPPKAAQGRGRRRRPRIVNRRPATKQHPGHKPVKRRVWRPLREIVAQRRLKSVRMSRPAVVVLAWQTPRRRPLLHYARLIEATPCQDMAAAINRQAGAERRRINQAEYADQQAQKRAQWRQEADAISRHWQRHEGHTEDIRRIKEGLRAEAKASDPGAPIRKLALYRQLAAIMGNAKL